MCCRDVRPVATNTFRNFLEPAENRRVRCRMVVLAALWPFIAESLMSVGRIVKSQRDQIETCAVDLLGGLLPTRCAMFSNPTDKC